MSLTYLGHCAFKFNLSGIRIYTDPYIQDPVDFRRLEPADLVLFSHGHFDHGVMECAKLWQDWKCQFVAPRKLVDWLIKTNRRVVPADAFIPLEQGESTLVNGVRITAVPAHHPVTRLGKTMHAIFSRSAAPGNPVNGYHFEGYYHSGDTLYTPLIAEFLQGFETHTACLPIGGKYKVASPQEALRIAEEIKAKRMVPMHWQPVVEQVPFRYQPSHLIKHAKETGSSIEICSLAIGETLEDMRVDRLSAP